MNENRPVLSGLSLAQRVALCSGADFWSTKDFGAQGIPPVTISDGPHGLRRQRDMADHLGTFDSVPATCFPTASATACSWDRGLLREIGRAIAEEALQEDVSVVLGPSVNLQRDPRGGRFFEYFSEDPRLTGELAAAWVDGLQSLGIGACVKHFASNSQETRRMTSDSVLDERTLRELYLSAFERVVKKARPASVMSAYNRVNGVPCASSGRLLRSVLRGEWGFAGATVTDWGGMTDRIEAFRAGLDLEMPGGANYFDADVLEAVRTGTLAVEDVDACASRVAALVRAGAAARRPGFRYDAEAHHGLARRAAAESAVLLKNEGALLPLAVADGSGPVAVIGALARTPRYQGAGSSRIVPSRLVVPLVGLDEAGVPYRFAEGYALEGASSPDLRAEAVRLAQSAPVAVLFVGLPDVAESEGYDRAHLRLPEDQDGLVDAVASVQPNLVVVISGGSPIEMPWAGKARAILQLHLGGQAVGSAVADLLTGAANPSGKLAATIPLAYEDVPSSACFAQDTDLVEYREGLYVGYRYYDKAAVPVRFPFGHGLSYTAFEYGDLTVEPAEATHPADPVDGPAAFVVSFTLTNVGKRDGAEIAQVYVGRDGDAGGYRPDKELRGFAKVVLKTGSSTRVEIVLHRRDFAWYDAEKAAWTIPDGAYRISVGASSRDLRLSADGVLAGDAGSADPVPPAHWYGAPGAGHPKATRADFEALLGCTVRDPVPTRRGAFTVENSLWDMRGSFLIRQFLAAMEATIRKSADPKMTGEGTLKMMIESVRRSPLRSLCLTGPQGMSPELARGLVAFANGKVLSGLRMILAKKKG